MAVRLKVEIHEIQFSEVTNYRNPRNPPPISRNPHSKSEIQHRPRNPLQQPQKLIIERLVLWSRIRDRVSDWLWSRLRSYWLAWSLTSLCYTELWSRSPWSRSRRPSVITTSTSSWGWGCRFDVVVVSTLSPWRRDNVVDSLSLSSGTSSSTMMTDNTDNVRRWTTDVVVSRCLSS